VRQADTVGRQGGDEFVVLLTEVRGENGAERVSQKIIAAMTKPIVVDGVAHPLGASIGIALFPADGRDPETLLKFADAAMYRAKSAGRGRAEFASRPQAPLQAELELDG
jgi:two-component system, sensor histidine kinase LadS